jgi:hypothetical protein
MMLITGTVAPGLVHQVSDWCTRAEGEIFSGVGTADSASSLKTKPDFCRLPRVPALPLHGERVDLGVT